MNTSFVLIFQNCPIRMLYLLIMTLWLDFIPKLSNQNAVLIDYDIMIGYYSKIVQSECCTYWLWHYDWILFQNCPIRMLYLLIMTLWLDIIVQLPNQNAVFIDYDIMIGYYLYMSITLILKRFNWQQGMIISISNK